jgi:hypothetical protein
LISILATAEHGRDFQCLRGPGLFFWPHTTGIFQGLALQARILEVAIASGHTVAAQVVASKVLPVLLDHKSNGARKPNYYKDP